MEEKPLVSIILPVYNAELYLRECMESILEQTYQPLEVILVDDGSKDNSPKICDEYAAAHPDIKVLHKKNAGSGAARNDGLEMAKGKYICFADADDKLDGAAAIEKMVCRAERMKADITVATFRRFFGREYTGKKQLRLKDSKDVATVYGRFIGFYMDGQLAYDWGKLYSADFLRKHRIRSSRHPYMQDKLRNLKCMAWNPVYAFLDESVYCYRENPGSQSERYREDLMKVWISIASDFRKYLEKHGKTEMYEDILAFHLFFGSFFLVKQELQGERNSVMAAAGILRQYGRHPLVKKAFRSLSAGKYVKELPENLWKWLIPSAAWLFRLHGYLFYALGIALLMRNRVDKKITKSRYREE